MLELERQPIKVITVQAASPAIESFASAGRASGGTVVPIAPDELMVLLPPDRPLSIVSLIEGEPEADGAVILDTTDGWVCWSLRGDDVHYAFSMLSEAELPAQGATCCDVAHVPARVVVRADDRIDVLVASPHEAYMRERILEDCASLKVNEVAPV